MMKRIAIAFCALLLALAVLPAAAHSELVKSEPAPGAQLAESPAEIRLTFNEPVAATSRIVLLAGEFQPVEGLVAQFNAARPQELYTPLPDLEPGTYTVQWTAASEDGHEVSGSYSFSVAPDSAASTTETAGSAAPGRPSWWIGALLAVAVGLPLVLLAVRRAGRR
jgi:methionine-rich copper-binding protein CopC